MDNTLELTGIEPETRLIYHKVPQNYQHTTPMTPKMIKSNYLNKGRFLTQYKFIVGNNQSLSEIK